MALEIENLTGGYGRRTVLKNVSAEFPAGKISSVIGRNGCGKSTLLQMCCGLLKPECGKILIDGENIAEIKHSELAKKVSYMEQAHNPGNITVRSLVSHGRFPHMGYPRRLTSRDREIVEQSMEQTGIAELAECSAAELSGGQLQRAYISMMMAQDTEILLLDEPSTFLDISSQLELMELVGKLKNSGKTVIMVLHDLNLVLTYSDYVVVMENGEVLGADTPEMVVESGIAAQAMGINISRCGNSWYFEKGKP